MTNNPSIRDAECQTRVYTLAFLLQPTTSAQAPQKVLLGMKKRGFGVGKWNGFGGKVETQDSSIPEAAIREIKEEAHVHVLVEDLQPRGELTFTFENSNSVMKVHVFAVQNWQGDPRESEEMAPKWFSEDELPYKDMWSDDSFWLPHVLAGKSVKGTFAFASDESTIIAQKLHISE